MLAGGEGAIKESFTFVRYWHTKDVALVKNPNLHESSRLSEKVVDSISGHPHHRGKGEAESEALSPPRVLVAAQLDRLEGDDVEDEDAEHDERGEVLPAEIPEDVWLVSRHLLDAVAEPVGPQS